MKQDFVSHTAVATRRFRKTVTVSMMVGIFTTGMLLVKIVIASDQLSVETKNGVTNYVAMQEIDPVTCRPTNGEPELNPVYQIVDRLQLPTSAVAYKKLDILDLLDDDQLTEYLATRSGAPLLESHLQGLLATQSSASDQYSNYSIQGKISSDFIVSNFLINKSGIALESPESNAGTLKLVVSDAEGLKIETRRYDPYQIVMIGKSGAMMPRLATVELKSDCDSGNKFVTEVDGRYLEFDKQNMDFRLLITVEELARQITMSLQGETLLVVDLP